MNGIIPGEISRAETAAAPPSIRRGHLVVTRRAGEALLIGSGPARIEIEVLRASCGQARIGIRAPRDMRISRTASPAGREPGGADQ